MTTFTASYISCIRGLLLEVSHFKQQQTGNQGPQIPAKGMLPVGDCEYDRWGKLQLSSAALAQLGKRHCN